MIDGLLSIVFIVEELDMYHWKDFGWKLSSLLGVVEIIIVAVVVICWVRKGGEWVEDQMSEAYDDHMGKHD